jgi:hypothetical protein
MSAFAAAPPAVRTIVWGSVDLDTGVTHAGLDSAADDRRCFPGVAPDPGGASTPVFACPKAADDAHSSFVPHTHELTSVRFVGEGIRASRR